MLLSGLRTWRRLIRSRLFRNATQDRRRRRRAPVRSGIEVLEDRVLLSIDIIFDYQFDTSGFFDNPDAKQALEAAGEILGSTLDDSLSFISPEAFERTTGEDVTWTARFYSPTDQIYEAYGEPICVKYEQPLGFGCLKYEILSRLVSSPEVLTKKDLVVPQNSLIIFVGAKDLLPRNADAIARAAPGWRESLTFTAGSEWPDVVDYRGQSGAIDNVSPTDYSTWGGNITFETKPNGGEWHFDHLTPPGDDTDFFSVALHEVGHVLGYTTFPDGEDGTIYNSSFEAMINSAGNFTGENSTSVYGENVPTQPGGAHWKDGTLSEKGTGFEAAMDPSLTPDRKLFTPLDFAGLQDIGWEVSASATGFFVNTVTGKVTDSSGNGIGGAVIEAGCVSTTAIGGCPLYFTAPIIATTKSDGTYTGTMGGLPKGLWTLYARRGMQTFATADINTDVDGLIETVNFQTPGGFSLVGPPATVMSGEILVFGDDNIEDQISILGRYGDVEVNVNGNLLTATNASQVTVESGILDDVITIDFSQGSPILFDGTIFVRAGTNSPGGDGDELVVSGGQFQAVSYDVTGIGAGRLFGDEIIFGDVEVLRFESQSEKLNVNFTDGPAHTVFVEDDGDPNNNKSMITIDGFHEFIFENPTQSLVVNGPAPSTSNDTLIVDLSTKNPIPDGGLIFNGRTGVDTLQFLGVPGNISYVPYSSNDPQSGILTIGSSQITFSGLEFVSPVAPVVDSVNIDSTVIDEDGTVTVSGSFVDPGSFSTYTVTIGWGDGASNTVLTPSVGSRRFSASHKYLGDNPNPSSTPFNNYSITVTVSDNDGLTGTGSTSVQVNNINEVPSIINAAVVNVAENETVAINVQSTDPDNETENGGGLVYSLTGGADEAKFSLNTATGILTFVAAPDFENPTDFGGNNVFNVQVTVTDVGGLTDVQDFVVTVTDANEAPSIITAAAVNIDENETAVLDAQSTDPDGETENGGGLTYSLSGGADLAKFSLDSATGVLTFKTGPNFESPTDVGAENVYDVQITVTDAGGLSGVQNLAVTVTDLESISTPVLGDSNDVVFNSGADIDSIYFSVDGIGQLYHSMGGRFGFSSGLDLDSVTTGEQTRFLSDITSLSYIDTGTNDAVRFNKAGGLYGFDFTSGSLNVVAGTISIEFGASLTSSGDAAISLTAARNIVLKSGSTLTTVNGGITLSANASGTAVGDFVGIDVDNVTILTTGTGNILLTGAGGDDADTRSHYGVYLENGSIVTSTATGLNAGTITIDGTGGDGITSSFGVYFYGSGADGDKLNVTSVDGDILIIGQGGTGTSGGSIGFIASGVGPILSTGTGEYAATITIDGTGGASNSGNRGLYLSGSRMYITSVDGDILITGQGGGRRDRRERRKR